MQGPHQGAQKSTMTGTCIEASSTSRAKVCVVVSLMSSPAVAAGVAAGAAGFNPNVGSISVAFLSRFAWGAVVSLLPMWGRDYLETMV